MAGTAQEKQSNKDKDDLLKVMSSQNAELIRRNEELSQKNDENALKQEKRDQEFKSIQQEQTEFARTVYAEQKEKNTTIERLQQSQIEKAEEIARLSSELNRLSIETLNRLTSKESYCYLRVIIPVSPNSTNDKNNTATVYLFHSGKYPIKNIRISMINTDKDAEEDPNIAVAYSDDPQIYNGVNHPYTENIPLLLPNQRLRLKDLSIVRRKQKSFNISFVDDNNIWYQRILLRDAVAYGAIPSSDIREFAAITEVYTLNLDPTLNHIYKFQLTFKKGPYLAPPNEAILIPFKDGSKHSFPTEKYFKWLDLHWNGSYLDNSFTISRIDKLDSPLKRW